MKDVKSRMMEAEKNERKDRLMLEMGEFGRNLPVHTFWRNFPQFPLYFFLPLFTSSYCVYLYPARYFSLILH